jgi:hypothetical protein
MEVAKALSFLGKYSAVTLIAAGKLPDSPTANTILAAIKNQTLVMAIVEAIAPVVAIIWVLSFIPVTVSVAHPHKACKQAPTDHIPIAQR